jgi:hypothetical protein
MAKDRDPSKRPRRRENKQRLANARRAAAVRAAIAWIETHGRKE